MADNNTILDYGEIENLDDGTLYSAFKNRSKLNSNSDCGSYWSSPKHYFSEFKKNPQIKLSDLRDQQNLNF